MADYPLVLLGERLFGVNAPHVVIRNREGAAAATYHLLDAGCRRIAVVGAVPHPEHDFSSGSIRTHGYREALAARDIPCDDSLLIETQGWGAPTVWPRWTPCWRVACNSMPCSL